jgi:amidohydrolase
VKTIIEAARALESELVANRRHLHANPELGDQLPGTVAFVTGKLDQLGIEWQPCGPCGIVACLGRPGRTLLLRGDMDALPIAEATDLPFRATNGWGHCCGHDLHTSMLLGAAAVLKQHEAELQGTVKLMFQPAEETGTGAKGMLDAGVLENPKVDAALAMHVASYLPPSLVLLTPRTMYASHDTFNVVVQGKGGHSSAPNTCIDPLNVVATIYMMLGSLVSRTVDPFETAVLTIGKLGGGTANNVIPDTAELAGGLRCYTKAVRDQTLPKVHAVIDRVTTLMGATCTLTTTSIPILNNDMDLRESLLEVIREVVGPEMLYLYDKAIPGTEDFAFITEQVPSLYMVLGAGQMNGIPHHNPNVVFDEQALTTGAALYANCAVEWLKRQG